MYFWKKCSSVDQFYWHEQTRRSGLFVRFVQSRFLQSWPQGCASKGKLPLATSWIACMILGNMMVLLGSGFNSDGILLDTHEYWQAVYLWCACVQIPCFCCNGNIRYMKDKYDKMHVYPVTLGHSKVKSPTTEMKHGRNKATWLQVKYVWGPRTTSTWIKTTVDLCASEWIRYGATWTAMALWSAAAW